MRKALPFRAAIIAASMALGILSFSASASALVTLGQLPPAAPTESSCNFVDSYDEFQTSVASGNSYVVPSSGVITSWSNLTGPNGGTLGLKVFRPLGGGTYLVVGHDSPRVLSPNSLNTFPVSIPVQAGDLIGLNVQPGLSNCGFQTGLAGDQIGYAKGAVGAGQTVLQESDDTEVRLNVSATLLPPPTVSSISPVSGSIAGGAVVIGGSNFASVTRVSFGTAPAAAVTVNSEGQITATAPASATLGSVPVTVTTVAGAATAPQLFTYEGCVVPKLKNKKLKAAKKKIRKSDCKVGKVKKLHDATAKTGKVVKQNPKPGQILVPGAKVKVTLDEA